MHCITDTLFDTSYPVRIPSGAVQLDGILHLPKDSKALVLFVHGSGSSRFSIRNQHVASILNQATLATLLFDLLTPEEDAIDARTAELRFDIDFLATRLIHVTQWCTQQLVSHHSIGYFGASTGGGAALVAAAKEKTSIVKAVVSRGGRPDLAFDYLSLVSVPTLLIVGGEDTQVIQLNQTALSQLNCIKKLEIVPNATHLFEEPGTLDIVAHLSKEWFVKFLL
jgi:putative phosphoribosyl transferase